jgi:hypothetical protein
LDEKARRNGEEDELKPSGYKPEVKRIPKAKSPLETTGRRFAAFFDGFKGHFRLRTRNVLMPSKQYLSGLMQVCKKPGGRPRDRRLQAGEHYGSREHHRAQGPTPAAAVYAFEG